MFLLLTLDAVCARQPVLPIRPRVAASPSDAAMNIAVSMPNGGVAGVPVGPSVPAHTGAAGVAVAKPAQRRRFIRYPTLFLCPK